MTLGVAPFSGQPELLLLHDIDTELVGAALQLPWIEHQAEGNRVLRGFRQSLQESTEFAQDLLPDGLPEEGGRRALAARHPRPWATACRRCCATCH